MINALQNFVNMGGHITKQVGNYCFGIDGPDYDKEVLAFNVTDGGTLEKSQRISTERANSITSVDELYDFMFGTPTAPDFTKVLSK